uniref:MANSC domain-containing protein n=1 Tax=Photinus pyralis TaxID=7054 RepID=A0A1Y1M2B5_PHOPY
MTRPIVPILLVFITICHSQLFENTRASTVRNNCPRLYPKIFQGYVPQGNISAGTYVEVPDLNNLKQCVVKCCEKEECNVAFRTDEKCYHITCERSETCAPVANLNRESIQHIAMVLVRPVNPDESWNEFIQTENPADDVSDRELSYLLSDPHRLEDAYKSLLEAGGSTYDYQISCSLGIPSCPENEECLQNNVKSRAGTCKCKSGYKRNWEGVCILDVNNMSESTLNISIPPETKKHLTVTAESKEVKYPTSEVTIIAYVEPAAPDGVKYQYDWISLQQPAGSAAVKHQNGEEMHLSKLSEGLFTFKVLKYFLDEKACVRNVANLVQCHVRTTWTTF